MCSLPAAGAVQRRMAAWPASPGWPPVALSSAQPIAGSGSAGPPCQVSFDEVGQGLELDGAGRLVDGAPTELPRELTLDRGQRGRIAAVDEFECVG